ncbi:MAG: PCRF domain-containing protein, partial [Chloroflexota bacterium]
MTEPSSLDAKLDEVARQYDELNAELARPETVQDLDLLKRLGREVARLEPVVQAYRRLLDVRAEREGAVEMRDAESDDEMKHLAHDEIERLSAVEASLVEELKLLLLPRDPADDGNVILEIRAGAGGDEAALFAGELLQMYLRYAGNHKYKT